MRNVSPGAKYPFASNFKRVKGSRIKWTHTLPFGSMRAAETGHDMAEVIWTQFSSWFKTHEVLLGLMGLLSFLMFVGTLIAVPLIIVALPHDFFTHKRKKLRFHWPEYWYVPYIILKNIFGMLFVLAGLAMLVLPGQGLLTLILGLALITFPGKRRLIRYLFGQPRVFKAVNRLRARFNKRPIEMPD